MWIMVKYIQRESVTYLVFHPFVIGWNMVFAVRHQQNVP